MQEGMQHREMHLKGSSVFFFFFKIYFELSLLQTFCNLHYYFKRVKILPCDHLDLKFISIVNFRCNPSFFLMIYANGFMTGSFSLVVVCKLVDFD